MNRARNTAGAPPESDVSGWVGLMGLAGLFGWIAVARHWPQIVGAFGLTGPSERLSGPMAALMALVFSSVPMLLWSVLVDKVHLRASTGIDWSRPRSISSIIHVSITKIVGLWATFAIIAAVYAVERYYWDGQYVFAMQVLAAAAAPLLLLSVPYVIWLDRVLVEPRDHAWHFGAMLIGREEYDAEEVKHHLRNWAVKGFFIAFMISILPGGWNAVVTRDWSQALSGPVPLAWSLIDILFLVDVQIAMVGYILTLRPLDAHIRSSNPYVAGWVAALICYPPFILMSGGPLDYHPNTADWGIWLEGHTAVLWVWGAALVLLTAVYSWATVAFGFRFSNLTYRGILTNGPYRFTRHPAYLSKNAFWWLSTMPILATSGSMIDCIRNTVLLGAVSAVYYWRARTEEKHLLAEDPKYVEYHRWMEENGPVTRALARLQPRRRASVQPAE